MRLTRLQLRQFRNIESLEFKPAGALNFIIGENAQGKTSLIESIFYLSSLKSFRTAHARDLIKLETDGALIDGHVHERMAEDTNLKVRLGLGERKVFINDKPVSPSKFVTRLRAVVFSPESLAAIKAGPELRRELIDTAAFQLSPTAAASQKQFLRALRQRNALLKQIRDGEIPETRGIGLLESLDEAYLKIAAEVVHERLRLFDELAPGFREALNRIIGEDVNPEFLYCSGGVPWTQRDPREISLRLRAELTNDARRVAEVSSGTTLTGPHRHDVSFLFNGNDSRIFCSQGQQRALILAFKISEIMYHNKAFESYPLLLLDDVLSEFDERKRHFLIDFLRKSEAQTFLTTTDRTQILEGCSVFEIKAGRIVS